MPQPVIRRSRVTGTPRWEGSRRSKDTAGPQLAWGSTVHLTEGVLGQRRRMEVAQRRRMAGEHHSTVEGPRSPLLGSTCRTAAQRELRPWEWQGKRRPPPLLAMSLPFPLLLRLPRWQRGRRERLHQQGLPHRRRG